MSTEQDKVFDEPMRAVEDFKFGAKVAKVFPDLFADVTH